MGLLHGRDDRHVSLDRPAAAGEDHRHHLVARVCRVAPGPAPRYSGLKDWRLWWLLFVASVLSIYAFFLWFRLQYPVKMLP